MTLSYKDAGVDKEAGYREVQLIKNLVKKTFSPSVITDLGGFGGLFKPDLRGLEEPVLVSGTDGVGTKLDIAFRMDKHDTIGIDAVAMCANDILCQGAKPLFFLDYIATGKLVPEKMAQIVEGVVEGCLQADMALIGGETAEMPGIYQTNHYDIAGFAVGIVDKKKMIVPGKVQIGDKVIGLKSSGLHSNGFSLVRKIVFDLMNLDLNAEIEELGMTLGEALLTPTRIYIKDVLPLIEQFDIHGIAHITGGGIYENLPRVLSEGQGLHWDVSAYQIPAIFSLLEKWGNVARKEMFATFNMGIGMVLILSPRDLEGVLANLDSRAIPYIDIGEVVPGNKEVQLWGL